VEVRQVGAREVIVIDDDDGEVLQVEGAWENGQDGDLMFNEPVVVDGE
jgi:hypothetical protein